VGDCGVCIGGFDGESAEFCNTEIRTARKAHKCVECNEVIQPGQKYENCAGKWEGDFDTFKTCMICVHIRQGLTCDGTWTFSQMWEEIEDYVFPKMTTGCLQKIETPEARAYLVKKWNEWKFKGAGSLIEQDGAKPRS
jgi:hypothetical protein